ncbi:MAG: TetR family transcriptional regulator [Candidatus Sphingomonas colombiensis]|nr:TetR/AcrR family transcriptional regulator [Sphingomonas sp.]WEK42226.1 MAG: TetR family transcriptional regulator [Sphingomonas sp.]
MVQNEKELDEALEDAEISSAGAGRRRRRRPEEVRALVLSAAMEEFATSGFDGASVRDIAARAGVSLSLLLYHFNSKENLWRELALDTAARLSKARGEGAKVKAASPREHLRAAIRALVEAFAEMPDFHRLMTIEAHRPSDRLDWLIETFIGEEHARWCELIKEAQKEGFVRFIRPDRLRFAITAMAAVPFAVSAEYERLSERNPFARAEVEETIAMIETLIFV